MTHTNKPATLERAADRLRQNGIILLSSPTKMESARIAHNADSKYPPAIGWAWISGLNLHYSSYVEDAHPAKIFKTLIAVLEGSAIDIDVDHRDRSIRLRLET